jgi:hypothetical protein
LAPAKFILQASKILNDQLLAALVAKAEAERQVETALITVCEGVPMKQQQLLQVKADQLCVTKKLVLSDWSEGVDPSMQVCTYFKDSYDVPRKDALIHLQPVIDATAAEITPFLNRANAAAKQRKKKKSGNKVGIKGRYGVFIESTKRN